MTREEAIQKHWTKWWEGKSPVDVVAFQLYEDKLCMPFGEFHKAIEAALGRGVFTHEFAAPEVLREEFEALY